MHTWIIIRATVETPSYLYYDTDSIRTTSHYTLTLIYTCPLPLC